ncbi:hypothetical protein MTR_6g007907 [Medicago truncatula]|uniref:Uncharacterized protein n=1 Tax=Medicago truncatula TaxID=3880 RepID=A0A072U6D7_MEDTR|nr:hypothetical protein MTR_6g007907 [Medicago truncatula]
MSDEKSDIIRANIVFVIAEKPHALYTMNENDILIEQKITHAEALKTFVIAEKPHALYTTNEYDILIEQKITHVEALKVQH